MRSSPLHHASLSHFDVDVCLLIADVLSGSSAYPVDKCNLAAACKEFHDFLASTLQTTRRELAWLRSTMLLAFDCSNHSLFLEPFATNRLSEDHATQLAETEYIKFGKGAFDDERIRLLPHMLLNVCPMTNLKVLNMQANNICDKGLPYLCAAFKQGSLCNLGQLRLDRNGIGRIGMTEFARTIANGYMCNLESLYLASNLIGNSELCTFAEAVKPNSAFPMGPLAKLTHLDLSSNQIADAGMQAFASAIAMGPMAKLVVLDLSLNQISDAGVISLSDAIAMSAMVNLRLLLLYKISGISDGVIIALENAISMTTMRTTGLSSVFMR